MRDRCVLVRPGAVRFRLFCAWLCWWWDHCCSLFLSRPESDGKGPDGGFFGAAQVFFCAPSMILTQRSPLPTSAAIGVREIVGNVFLVRTGGERGGLGRVLVVFGSVC